MKFTLSWLKSHLETEADAKTIAETLTSIGLEVEGVTARIDGLENGEAALHRRARRPPALGPGRHRKADGLPQLVCALAHQTVRR